MRSIVPRGCDRTPVASGQAARMRRRPALLCVSVRPVAGRARTARWGPALLLTAALAVAACGGSDGDEVDAETVTGRVVSLEADASRYCVSPDRGETETCVDVPDPTAVDGIDVGECVTTSRDLTVEGAKVEVVDEAACAAGDLGEDADDGS